MRASVTESVCASRNNLSFSEWVVGDVNESIYSYLHKNGERQTVQMGCTNIYIGAYMSQHVAMMSKGFDSGREIARGSST